MIRAHDSRLHCISVVALGFLLPEGASIPEGTLVTQPIPRDDLISQLITEGIPRTTFPTQHTTGESTSSQPTPIEDDEEEKRNAEEIVDILESNSKDLYEVFDQPRSPTTSTSIPSHSSSPQLSHSEEAVLPLDEIGIQRKKKSTLLELLESQPGKDAPTKAPQTKLPTPPLTQPPQIDLADPKRKREDKGKEVIEGGKNLPPRESEHQRASKQPHIVPTRSAIEGDKRADHQAIAPVWAPLMEVDGVPLFEDASIRDFQRGVAGYVADAVEQSLLLPKDMVDLRSIRYYKVFLGLKKDLVMVKFSFFLFFVLKCTCYLCYYFYLFILILSFTSFPFINYLFQATHAVFRVEEIVNSSHRKMKEEEGRRIAGVETFQVVEKSNKELKTKLAEEEKERKYAAAALNNAEKQAESQRLLLHNTKDQLAISKEHISALKSKLEEIRKAKDQADKAREEAEKARETVLQKGYEIGVAETEEALRAEVLGVCRI